MTRQLSISELLQKHRENSSKSPREFVQNISNRCHVHEASVYRWISGAKLPNHQNTLTVVDYLKSLKSRK